MNAPDSGARFWDERLARLLVRPFATSFLKPNHVTALSLLAGLSAGVCYAIGGGAANWGGVLFILAAFADHVDGELARMSGQTSRFGHYFDYLTGAVNYFSLFAGMGVGLRGSFLRSWSLPLGIAVGVFVGLMYVLHEIERWLGRGEIVQPSWDGFQAEDFMYLLVPITWLGGSAPFLAAAGVGVPVFLAWQVWDSRRFWRGRSSP